VLLGVGGGGGGYHIIEALCCLVLLSTCMCISCFCFCALFDSSDASIFSDSELAACWHTNLAHLS